MPESLINKVLERGVAEVIVKDHLQKALRSKKKLRVKLGIDPTASDLHLGHTVVLRKLRQFQDLGHQAVLIIGDFTGLIGDPSGRSAERPLLTEADVKENMRDYLKQAGKVLDLKKLEVRYNSEWFKDKKSDFIMDLMSRFTVARSLERDDFQKRLKANEDLSVTEILYPLLQGYDSVAIKADVELGGTDQKFNLLTGRRVQRRFGLPEQDILTVPLLVGLDGERKMSKSLGNYIGLSDQPAEMYAKVMSWADETMLKAFELLTDVDMAEVKVWQKQLGPRDFKARLAFEVTKIFHGERGVASAQAEFDRVFRAKEAPTEIREVKIKAGKIPAVELLVKTGLAVSKGEARRVIEQGGMKLNGKVITDAKAVLNLSVGDVIQRGKRHFIRII